MHVTHRLAGLIGAAVLAAGLAAAPTSTNAAEPAAPAERAAVGTGTITYVKSHNVWVARQDGSGARQVTSGGTARVPWRSPTQSDAGAIVAGRGNLIYRMDQWGTVLATLDPPNVSDSAGQMLGGPPAHIAVSPDGSKIAYTYEKYSCPLGLACKMRYVTAFTSSSRVTSPTAWGVTYYDAPSWVTNTRVAVNQDLIQNVRLFDLGRGDIYWFDENVYTSDDRTLTDFEISRRSKYAVAVRGEGHQTQVAFFSISGNYLNGGRPPFPVRMCTTTEELGISSPTWSADGSLAAWQEPGGVWAVAMGAAPCETNPYLMIRGASQPSYSPAAMQRTRPTYSFRATKKPRIGGTAKVGKRLSATRGGWSPSPAVYRFQWLRDGKAIRGATKAAYRVTKKDRRHALRVKVTVSRTAFRTAKALSAPVRVKR